MTHPATAKLRGLLKHNKTKIMGVLNITPDSFFDGGRYLKPSAAWRQADEMIAAGADVIDIGGESTRPGAQAVDVDEELRRVLPAIQEIRRHSDIPISIDTSKAEVMREAIKAGANMINDVRALREPNALATAAELRVPVCLMHMQGEPRTMQDSPTYTDVVRDVFDFLSQRIAACEAAGIRRQDIIIDPGFGFGKTLQHNLRLLRELARFNQFGLAVLVGVSRKSMLGTILDKPAEQRLFGSVALATLACWFGATLLRVHDVAATVDAVNVCEAVRNVMPVEGIK